jgi:diguanylate cyclase (GGDEF)-like protein
MKKRFLQPRLPPRAADGRAAFTQRYERRRALGISGLRFHPELEREYRASAVARGALRIRIIFIIAFLLFATQLRFGDFARFEPFVLAVTALLCAVGLYLHERSSREHFRSSAEWRQQAQIDDLTGVMNRRAFRAHLGRIWRQAERARVPVGIVLLDIDRFKQLNDQHGHLVGDRVLRRTAEILKTYALRPLDAVGRFGGDEFVMAWYDADPVAFAALMQLLPAKLWMGLAAVHANAADQTVSGGAVLAWPSAGTSIESAMLAADEELYRIKRSNRGAIALAQPAPAADAGKSSAEQP